VENNQIEDDNQEDDNLKKLYRQVVKVTHPDKVKNKSLNSFYIDATNSYNNDDYINLYLIAIKLDKNDSLKSALLVEKGDEIMLATAKGQSIRFKEGDIREMGRTAGGVRGMKLGKSDVLVGVDCIKKDMKDASLLTMSANGLGKKTFLKEYKVQKRGGSGIKTAKVTPKTGELIVAKVISIESELIAMSKKGQVIRTNLDSIPTSGRQTQGVTIMKMRAGDGVASIACL
jgi:DNA gyrase subunit A